jgi:hypothetical protein
MTSNKQLSNFELFIKEQITQLQSKVVIATNNKGLKVNNFQIVEKNNSWSIVNANGDEISKVNSKRLAVLFAALATKKKFDTLRIVNCMDSQLFVLKHDKNLFESKILNNHKRELFEDRLSRTTDELSKVYSQISELEKSAGLQ